MARTTVGSAEIAALQRAVKRFVGATVLPRDVVDDCSIEFLERMIQPTVIARWVDMPEPGRSRYLDIAAKNHVAKFSRSYRRLKIHESEWPYIADDNSAEFRWEPEDPTPGPEEQFLEHEKLREILLAIGELTMWRQEVLRRMYFEGASVREIAQSTTKTEIAVRRCLSDARRKLKEAVEHRSRGGG